LLFILGLCPTSRCLLYGTNILEPTLEEVRVVPACLLTHPYSLQPQHWSLSAGGCLCGGLGGRAWVPSALI